MLRRLRDRQTRLGLKRRSAGADGGGAGGGYNSYSGVVDDEGGVDSHDDADCTNGGLDGGIPSGDSFDYGANDAANSTGFGNTSSHRGRFHPALQEDALSQQHSQMTMQSLKQVDPNFDNWDGDDHDDDDDHHDYDDSNGGYNSHSQLNANYTTNQYPLLDSIHVHVVPSSTSPKPKQSPHRLRHDISQYRQISKQRMQHYQNQRRRHTTSRNNPPFQSSALTIHSTTTNSLISSTESHSLGSTHAMGSILQEKKGLPSSSSPLTRHLAACGMDINNHHPCNSTTITSTTVNSSGESCSLNEYSQMLFTDPSTKLDATMSTLVSSTLASETVGESTLESATLVLDEHNDDEDNGETRTNTSMSEMDVDEITDAYRNALRDLDSQVQMQEARACAENKETTAKMKKQYQYGEKNGETNKGHVIQQTMQSIIRKHEHHYQPTPPQRRSRPGSVSIGNNGGSGGKGKGNVSSSRDSIPIILQSKVGKGHKNENENHAAKQSTRLGQQNDLPKDATNTKSDTTDTVTPAKQTAQSAQPTANIDVKSPALANISPPSNDNDFFGNVRIISNVHGDVTAQSPSNSSRSTPKDGQNKSHSYPPDNSNLSNHHQHQKLEPTHRRQSSLTKNQSTQPQPTLQSQQKPPAKPQTQSESQLNPQSEPRRAVSPPRSMVASTTVASTVRHANGNHLIDRLLRQSSANAKRQQQEKTQQQQEQRETPLEHQQQQQQEQREKQQQQQREKRLLKIQQQKGRRTTPFTSAINAKNLSPPTEPDGKSISELIASSTSPPVPNRNNISRGRPDPPPDPPSNEEGISETRKSNTPKRSRPLLLDRRNIGNNFLRQKQQQRQQGRHNQQNQSEEAEQSLHPRHQKDADPEWTTPIPLKKVQSSQSKKSESTHTFQTANTTTTSRFWDEVEEFSDGNDNAMKSSNNIRHGNHRTRDDKNNDTPQHAIPSGDPLEGIDEEEGEGLHGDPRKLKHAGERDFVIVRKNNMRNRELHAFFNSRSTKGAASLLPSKGRRSPTPGRRKRDTPISPIPDEDDNASNSFSLHLNGSFDDENISALEMGDSATVYHLRATQSDSDHWKMKYERLRQETQSLVEGDDGLARTGLSPDNDDQEEAANINSHPMAMPCSSPLVALQKFWDDPETVNNDAENPSEEQLDQTQFIIEQQQRQQNLLLRCGDYGGGKKAKDFAQTNSSSDRASKKANNDKGKSENAPGTKQWTSLPLSSAELGWMLRRAREARDASLCKVHGGSQVPEEGTQPPTTATNADDYPHEEKTKTTTWKIEEDVCEGGIEMGEDEDDSVPKLKVIGGADMDSPTHNSSRIRRDVPNIVTPDGPPAASLSVDGDATTYSAQPTYVLYDEGDEDELKLLKQWNRDRNRNQKSLADDLTVGTPRSRKLRRSNSDDSQSELSENAKLIFDAALKQDVKTLRRQRSASLSRSRVSGASQNHRSTSSSQALSHVSSLVESFMSSHFTSNIPRDFSSWFELPSPGGCCISLIPLLDESTRSAIVIELLASFDGVTDKLDAHSVPRITPCHRVGDVVDRAFDIFLQSWNLEGSENEGYTGPIVADGDDGSIRFANAALHLRGIFDVALGHAKNREFQDAIDVYNTLLRSCQTSSKPMFGLVGQLIASTLHNLSVLYIWNKEFDQALPYCRECLRIKTELVGDSVEAVECWANMGLISYAMESFTSSLTSFRKAAQLSSEVASRLSGIFINNIACVHTEMSKLSIARTEFDKSVQVQKGESLDISFDSVALGREELLSISISIFNVGVSCAKQKQYEIAVSHVDACVSIQSNLMEDGESIVQTTMYYLNLLKSLVPTSPTSDDSPTPDALRSGVIPIDMTSKSWSEKPRSIEPKVPDYTLEEESYPNKHFRKRSKSPRLRSSITRRCKSSATTNAEIESEIKYEYPFFTKNNEISHPMISLGSLRNEPTSAARVQQSLETCEGNLSLEHGANKLKGSIYTNQVAIGRNQNLRLICTSVKDSKTLPQNIINFGLRRIRRRETQRVLDSVESELNNNLQRYGPRHPLVGLSHNSLGLVHMYTGNYEEAISEFEKSIIVNNEALGLKHPDVSATLMFKGLAQLALEKFEDANVSMLRVRQSREDALGIKHKEIGLILNNLGCVQYELGDFKAAETLFQEALDMQREIFTTEHSFLKSVSVVLCNIAYVHAKIGSFPKALIELEGALQIRRDILFEDNVEDDDIAENMAHILAIHQLQHGSGNLDDITKEYISMLKEHK